MGGLPLFSSSQSYIDLAVTHLAHFARSQDHSYHLLIVAYNTLREHHKALCGQLPPTTPTPTDIPIEPTLDVPMPAIDPLLDEALPHAPPPAIPILPLDVSLTAPVPIIPTPLPLLVVPT
ncbi:hypothetical protein GUJ93_ZPchr0011g27344 [Zizania palustris]|uniref:Uncharacterized protein n=1 Tax=Zizania palustris TaxID=103762 RepID=A0A8J5WJ02_ZIZPA|nr:hypothetical protein GUJ93_ZPchr0011g27344 [Zizania palustris]